MTKITYDEAIAQGLKKECTGCGEEKLVTEFYRSKEGKFGIKAACKCCCRDYCEKNKDKISEYRKSYYEKNKDKISERDKSYYEKNKDKINEYKKSYYEKNKDYILKSYKSYYEKNKDKINEYKKSYYEKNKDKVNERTKYYQKNRQRTDPEFAILIKLRKRLNNALKYKKASTKELLGAELDVVLNHLQKTAEENYPGTDFDINNYSGKEWHIDHIRPLSSFNLVEESEQIKACHYTNLQILTAEDNFTKGKKYKESLDNFN
jgi:hypothetical protein